MSLAERALGITLRHLDATAAIQTEQQQFLMSGDVGTNVSLWLTVTGADAQWTSDVYRDMLAWKGLITARQQGLRLALKDDPLFKLVGMIFDGNWTYPVDPSSVSTPASTTAPPTSAPATVPATSLRSELIG